MSVAVWIGEAVAWVCRARGVLSWLRRKRKVDPVGVVLETRGEGRNLRESDFGNGRIDQLSRDDFGSGWMNVNALSAYRLNEFLRWVGATGVKWKLTSAWRSLARNKEEGGADNSRHLVGAAFDVWLFDPKFFQRITYYVDLARRVGFQGIGLYEGKPLVHMDNRAQRAGWGRVNTGGGGTQFVSLSAAIARLTVPDNGTMLAAVFVTVAANYFIFGG